MCNFIRRAVAVPWTGISLAKDNLREKCEMIANIAPCACGAMVWGFVEGGVPAEVIGVELGGPS